jgi:hypothetical protein
MKSAFKIKEKILKKQDILAYDMDLIMFENGIIDIMES